MAGSNEQIQQLKSLMQTLESQRSTFGDVAVNSALGGIEQKLAEMEGQKTAQNKILELNKELDHKVKERTQELQQTLLQMEQQHSLLQETEEKYRTLFENAPVAIFVIQDERTQFANSEAERLYGHSALELVSKDFIHFIHKEDQEMVLNRYRRRLKGEEPPNTYSFRIVTKYEEIRWVEIKVIPFSWENRPAILSFQTDITDREQAERALEHKASFATVMDYIGDMVEISDTTLQLEYINPAHEKIMGYSRTEVLGKSPASLFRAGKHSETFYQEIWEAISKGDIWRGEITGKRKNGSLSYQEMAVSPVRNEEGKIINYVAVKRDITERKKTEENIKKMNEELEQRVIERTSLLTNILENLDQAVVTFDSDWKLQMWNEHWREITQFSTDLLEVGQPLQNLLRNSIEQGHHGSGDPNVLTEKRLNEIRKGLPNYIEISNKHFYVIPQKTPDGGLVFTFTDITEIKKAENLIKEREENLNRVFNAIPFPGAITSYPDGQYLKVNQQHKNWHKVSEKDALKQKAPSKYMDINDRKKIHQALIDYGHIENYELQFKRIGTGEARWCVYSGYRTTYFDKQAIIGFHVDITERKQIELDLMASKKEAEDANRAKSQFLATMSHEIRTPLNSILGFSEILLKQPLNADSEEFRKYLENIRQSGQNLSELINNILDFSKIEAGEIPFSEEEFELKKLVKEIFYINKAQALEKLLQFRYEFDESLPLFIKTDRTKLSQVLMNLTSNAIKFTPVGKKVFLKAFRGEDALIFEVFDEGIGIPEEYQQSIFEAFKQVDNSTTRHYGGTGLGLTIAKKMVSLLEGTIQLKSTPDQGGRRSGSTFSVSIPLNEVKEKGETSQHETSKPLFAPDNVIVVVEDNLMNQQVIKTFFHMNKQKIHLLANGEDAIKTVNTLVAEGHPPHLILMDLHMPGMDGFEAAKHIQTTHQEKNIPIIALSADAFTEQRQAALEAGFLDYITKPFDFDQLTSILTNYLPIVSE